MTRILLIISILVLVFLIAIYPFKIRAAVHINVLEDIGFAVVKLFWIKLFCGKFKISSNGKLLIESTKKKKKKNKAFVKGYFGCIIKSLDIKKIEFYFTGGSDSDAYFVSQICGVFSAISACIFSFAINEYKDVKLYRNIEPRFDEDRLETTFGLALRLNLLSVLSALFCGVKSYFNEKKVKRNV